MLKIFAAVIFITLFVGLISWCRYAEYQAVKKYYPDMTFWEWSLLEERLRITPQGVNHEAD